MKIKHVIITLLSIIFLNTYSQNKGLCNTKNDSLNNLPIYNWVDKQAEFTKGSVAFNKYLKSNIKNYCEPTNNCYSTPIDLTFVVDTTGKIRNVCFINRNSKELSVYEKEILKAMENSPKWKSGELKGKRVNSRL